MARARSQAAVAAPMMLLPLGHFATGVPRWAQLQDLAASGCREGEAGDERGDVARCCSCLCGEKPRGVRMMAALGDARSVQLEVRCKEAARKRASDATVFCCGHSPHLPGRPHPAHGPPSPVLPARGQLGLAAHATVATAPASSILTLCRRETSGVPAAEEAAAGASHTEGTSAPSGTLPAMRRRARAGTHGSDRMK